MIATDTESGEEFTVDDRRRGALRALARAGDLRGVDRRPSTSPPSAKPQTVTVEPGRVRRDRPCSSTPASGSGGLSQRGLVLPLPTGSGAHLPGPVASPRSRSRHEETPRPWKAIRGPTRTAAPTIRSHPDAVDRGCGRGVLRRAVGHATDPRRRDEIKPHRVLDPARRGRDPERGDPRGRPADPAEARRRHGVRRHLPRRERRRHHDRAPRSRRSDRGHARRSRTSSSGSCTTSSRSSCSPASSSG